MKDGREIVKWMIQAAGLENEEDLAVKFGVEIDFVNNALPIALEFFTAFCEICDQNPGVILKLQESAQTGRTRDREGYFIAHPERIGIASGRFEVANSIDEDNAEVEKLFKGLMKENAGKLNFIACEEQKRLPVSAKGQILAISPDDDSAWIHPIVEEVRQIREKLMAECGNDMSKYFEKILRMQDEMKAAGRVFVSFEKGAPDPDHQEPEK